MKTTKIYVLKENESWNEEISRKLLSLVIQTLFTGLSIFPTVQFEDILQ